MGGFIFIFIIGAITGYFLAPADYSRMLFALYVGGGFAGAAGLVIALGIG